MLTELLELIADTAEKNCSLGTEISWKSFRQMEAYMLNLVEGFTESVSYNKQEVKMIPVLFLCRHADQKRCLEQLCEIAGYLSGLKKYPQGKTFSWLDTTVAKEPSKIGRDEDGVYHYSCILNCKIYC